MTRFPVLFQRLIRAIPDPGPCCPGEQVLRWSGILAAAGLLIFGNLPDDAAPALSGFGQLLITIGPWFAAAMARPAPPETPGPDPGGDALIRECYERSPLPMGVVEIRGGRLRAVHANPAAGRIPGREPGIPWQGREPVWLEQCRRTRAEGGVLTFGEAPGRTGETPRFAVTLTFIPSPREAASPQFSYLCRELDGPASHASPPAAWAEPDSVFLAMAETVPDILFMVRPDGSCEYLNQRFYDFTGTPPGSGLGFGWAQVLHPEERAAHLLQWEAVLQSPALAGIRGRLRAADGHYQWFFARLRPVTDGQGRVVRWLGAASNIHSLTQSEEQLRLLNESLEQRVSDRTAALRDSEARLRAIFDSAVEGILTMNEAETIESANPAALSCFGYAAGELNGRKLTALLPDPHLPPDGQYTAESLLPGSGTKAGVDRELIGVRRDGSRFPAHLSMVGFRADGRQRFAGFVRDLTVQKRLEHLILEISER